MPYYINDLEGERMNDKREARDMMRIEISKMLYEYAKHIKRSESVLHEDDVKQYLHDTIHNAITNKLSSFVMTEMMRPTNDNLR